AVTRAYTAFVRQEDARETPRKFLRNFFQGQHLPGADWAFHFETFTKEKVITLERFDDEEVDREPDRAAPIRVATEKITRSLARNIIDTVFLVADTKDVRVIVMGTRDRAQSVRRKEFVFVEHVAQRAAQPFARWDREHPVAGGRAHFAIGDKGGEILTVIEKPIHPLLESGQFVNLCGLEIFHRDQRQQPDE